jgi:hypothetical protein
LEVASNKLVLLQGVRKIDDDWSFVPPHFAIAEWRRRRSSSRETSSLRGTSLLEESRSKEVEVQAMTPNLKSTTQLDHQVWLNECCSWGILSLCLQLPKASIAKTLSFLYKAELYIL